MSLILDALRKADAERVRGSVPSLHSHPVPPLSAERPPATGTRSTWPWIAIGIAVGLAGAVTWMWVTRDSRQVVELSPPAAAGASGPASVQAPPATMPPPATEAGAGAAPGRRQPVAQPAPWPQPEERMARPDPKASPPVTYLGNVPPADAAVVPREQLPAEIRGALPQMTIGGSIYSKNPRDRSLIINGQLFREQDRLTPDLSLEEIRLKAAVFSFRGYRFEVLF